MAMGWFSDNYFHDEYLHDEYWPDYGFVVSSGGKAKKIAPFHWIVFMGVIWLNLL